MHYLAILLIFFAVVPQAVPAPVPLTPKEIAENIISFGLGVGYHSWRERAHTKKKVERLQLDINKIREERNGARKVVKEMKIKNKELGTELAKWNTAANGYKSYAARQAEALKAAQLARDIHVRISTNVPNGDVEALSNAYETLWNWAQDLKIRSGNMEVGEFLYREAQKLQEIGSHPPSNYI